MNRLSIGPKESPHDFDQGSASQGGSSRLIVVWTSTVARVVMIRVNQPLLCSKFLFQTGSLSATLSINTYQDDLGNLVTDNGIPR
jgi:hypothetical protein